MWWVLTPHPRDRLLLTILFIHIFVLLYFFFIIFLDYRDQAVQILTRMMTSMQVISHQQLLDRSVLWVTRQLTRRVLCGRTL